MVQPTPPGWYPTGDGYEMFYDGNGWIADTKRQPFTSAPAQYGQPSMGSTPAPQQQKQQPNMKVRLSYDYSAAGGLLAETPWYKRWYSFVAFILLTCVVIGLVLIVILAPATTSSSSASAQENAAVWMAEQPTT